MTPAIQSKVLEAFNIAARFKALDARLSMMLEEITTAVDDEQNDGLQEKAQAAIPVWNDWLECLHLHGGWLREDPKILETDLVLAAAAAGIDTSEILRQVMRQRQNLASAVKNARPGWKN